MKNLDNMSIAVILKEINLCISATSLYDIWKADVSNIPVRKTSSNPKGLSGLRLLDDRDYADELVTETGKLGVFLFEHDAEIDKVKFVMTIISNYKEILKKNDLTPEVRKEHERNLAAARKLLKGTDRTLVYYSWETNTGRIEDLIIMGSKFEAENQPRPRRIKNVERLQALEQDENFGNIVQALTTSDVEYMIPYKQQIGSELRFMIEYNSLLDSVGGDTEAFTELLYSSQFEEVVAQKDDSVFVEELIKQLRRYIEEIDIDKMLLCSALRYIKAMELGGIDKANAPKVYKRLQVIQKHLKKNAQLVLDPTNEKHGIYHTSDLECDMKRFIGKDDSKQYLPIRESVELRMKILTGEVSLNDISVEMYEAIQLNIPQNAPNIAELLESDPNNYMFFLRQEKCKYQKDTILRDIINSGKCSCDLLQLLCEKTDVTSEEVRDLFDRGIISVGDLKSVREQIGEIITPENLFEKYKEFKAKRNNPEEAEKSRTALERYALAYRNTELIGKKHDEIEEKGEEFVAAVGDEIEPADLVPLYGLDVIPLKVAVDWGGENIIEQLLRNETLKPADARYLRDNGLLDEKVLERLFRNSINMSYSYQVALVCTVFDGQTPEEQEIRERLAQYYNIENAMGNSSKKGQGARRSGATRGEANEPREMVQMRDPGAKYNLLLAIDNDTKIEEGIIDGHIIFHYPNVGDGTVLIEKLHKITSNRQTGLIEIKADNEAATYVMSEEEFIKIKAQLIKEGKVDRTELTQRWWVTRDPEHWIPHNGTSGWERALKERFGINEQNSRYSPEDLAKIEELIARSIESKKGNDR